MTGRPDIDEEWAAHRRTEWWTVALTIAGVLSFCAASLAVVVLIMFAVVGFAR